MVLLDLGKSVITDMFMEFFKRCLYLARLLISVGLHLEFLYMTWRLPSFCEGERDEE